MVRNMLPLKMNNPKLTLCVLLLTACACILPGAAFVIKPKCSELQGTVELMNDPDFCEVVSNLRGDVVLGNKGDPVTLDFSKADETTLNTLLAKFNTITGAIVMDGNDQVETLDFGKIQKIDGQYISPGVAMLIRNNLKLKKIEWNSAIDVFNHDIAMLIYNCPLLTSPLDTLRTVLTGSKKIKPYFQSTGLGECQFEHPLTPADSSKYIPPTAEFLKACKKIKGDLILENINLSGIGPIELDSNACLRLVNVNMKNANLVTQAMAGKETCKDGTQSKLSNNADLCGIDLEGLHNYFKDRALVVSEPDVATCTVQCPPAQASVYIHCATPPPTASPPSYNSTPTDDPITPSGGNASELHQRTTTPKPQKPSISIPLLVAVLFGCVLILAVAAYLFYKCFWKKKKEKKGKKTTKKSGNSSPSGNGNRPNSTVTGRQPSSKPSHQDANNGSGSTSSTDAPPKVEGFSERLTPDLSNLDNFCYRGQWIVTAVRQREPTKDPNYPENITPKTFTCWLYPKFVKALLNMVRVDFLRKGGLVPFKKEFADKDYCGTSDKKRTKYQFEEGQKDVELKKVGALTVEDAAHTENIKEIMRYPKLGARAKSSVGNDIEASWVDLFGLMYICTQGPLERTLEAFWRMIFGKKVVNIVSLTGWKEGKKDKCYPYLPDENEEKKWGDSTVRWERTVEFFGGVIINRQYTKMTPGCQDVLINHWHFLKWTDHDALHPKYLLLLIDLMEHLKGNGQTLVHCSAGIGRTGTIVLLSLLIERLKNGDLTADLLADTLRQLRDHRGSAVQKPQQYLCAVLAMLTLGLRDGIFKNTDDVVNLFNLILDDFERHSGENATVSAEDPSNKSNPKSASKQQTGSNHSQPRSRQNSKSKHSKKGESKETKQKQSPDHVKPSPATANNQAKPSPVPFYPGIGQNIPKSTL